MFIRIINKFFLSIFISSIFFSCSNSEKKEEKLTSISVTKGFFRKEIKAKGIISPIVSENIITPMELFGTLEKLAPEGSKVKKGDLIAKINVRELINESSGIEERMDNTKAEAEKQRIKQPNEIFVLNSNLENKKNNFKTKSIDYELVKKSTKEDVQEKIISEIKNNEIKIEDNDLEKKKILFERGYLPKQEFDTVNLTDNKHKINLEKSKISKIQNEADYNIFEINKGQLLKEQSKLDFEIGKIERKADESLLKTKNRNSTFRSKQFQKRFQKFQKKVNMANIYSPIDGIIIYPKIWGWQKPYVGMEVWSGFSFLTVAQTEKIKIDVKVNEIEISDVKKDQETEIILSGTKNNILKGKINNISKLAKYKDNRKSEGLKYFDVEVIVDKATEDLKNNMNIDLNIISNKKQGIYVPIDSVIEENNKKYIYFDENNQKIKKEVKIVDRNENFCLLDGKYTGKEKVFIL